MRLIILFPLFISRVGWLGSLSAQPQTTETVSDWEHSAALNFYFFQDPFIFLPAYEVNKGHLHFGARYNYEDLETFSAWAGYNFMGGNMLEYVITPMAGVIIGNTDGFAGGLQVELDYKRLSLYSESEYVFDVRGPQNDFYYNWTDISYAVTGWLNTGISFQRTRLYHSEADIQSGLLLGGSWKVIDITTYLYNPFSDDPFLILTFSRDF